MRNLGEMVNLSTFLSTDIHISLSLSQMQRTCTHKIVLIPHLFGRKAVSSCAVVDSIARMRTRYEGGAARECAMPGCGYEAGASMEQDAQRKAPTGLLPSG